MHTGSTKNTWRKSIIFKKGIVNDRRAAVLFIVELTTLSNINKYSGGYEYLFFIFNSLNIHPIKKSERSAARILKIEAMILSLKGVSLYYNGSFAKV